MSQFITQLSSLIELAHILVLGCHTDLFTAEVQPEEILYRA